MTPLVWTVTEFVPCSAMCGQIQTTQTRTVVCMNEGGVVADAVCTNAGMTKPNTTSVCPATSDCSANTGGGGTVGNS